MHIIILEQRISVSFVKRGPSKHVFICHILSYVGYFVYLSQWDRVQPERQLSLRLRSHKRATLLCFFGILVWFKHSTSWFNRLCLCSSCCGCNLIFGLFLHFETMCRCYFFCDVYEFVLKKKSNCPWVIGKYLVKSVTIMSHHNMPGVGCSHNTTLWTLQTKKLLLYLELYSLLLCCCWLWKATGALLFFNTFSID